MVPIYCCSHPVSLARRARARECFFHFRDCFALSWKSFRADKALIGCVYIYVEYVWCIEDDRAEAQKFIACNRKPDFILTLFTCFGGPFWISNLRRPRERKSERVRQKFYATAPYINGRKCALLDVRKSFWAKWIFVYLLGLFLIVLRVLLKF